MISVDEFPFPIYYSRVFIPKPEKLSGANFMKLFTHVAFLMLFALPLFVFAQTSAKLTADSSYKFGSRTIRIPEPDGLVEVVSLYPAMKDRFTDMVGPNYDLIAGFISRDLIPS